MDGDYETPQPEPAIIYEEFDTINGSGYDSQYEQLPPDDRRAAAPTSTCDYTLLNSLTTATSSTGRDNTALPDYEPGLVNNLTFTTVASEGRIDYTCIHELLMTK